MSAIDELTEWRDTFKGFIDEIKGCIDRCPWWALDRRKAYTRNLELYSAYVDGINVGLMALKAERARNAEETGKA